MNSNSGLTPAGFIAAVLMVIALILLVLFFPAINVHGQVAPTAKQTLDRMTDHGVVGAWVKEKAELNKNLNPTSEEIKQARELDLEIFARWANILSLKFAMSTQDEMWHAWFGPLESIECRNLKFKTRYGDVIKEIVKKLEFDPYFRDLEGMNDIFIMPPLFDDKRYPDIVIVRDVFIIAPLFEGEKYPEIVGSKKTEGGKPRKIVGVKIARMYRDSTCYYSLKWDVPPKVEKRIVTILPNSS